MHNTKVKDKGFSNCPVNTDYRRIAYYLLGSEGKKALNV